MDHKVRDAWNAPPTVVARYCILSRLRQSLHLYTSISMLEVLNDFVSVYDGVEGTPLVSD